MFLPSFMCNSHLYKICSQYKSFIVRRPSYIEFSIFECGKDTLQFDKNIDVVFIDARHSYNEIKEDMLSVLNYFNNPTIIMDDFGNPNNGMKDAIQEIIEQEIVLIKALSPPIKL